MNYKGSIINLLFAAIEKKQENTVGEILYSFLNKNSLKKHYVQATDEELYTCLESYLYEPEEEDEPLDEQAFNFWVEQHLIVKE